MAFEAGELWFWASKPGRRIEPEDAIEAIEKNGGAGDLAEIPVDQVVVEIDRQYPQIKWSENFPAAEVDVKEEEAAFRMSWGPRHIQFQFFGNAWKQMDRVVGLMRRFGVWCYARKERKAYPPEEPPRFSPTAEEERISAEWEKVLMEESAKIDASTENPFERKKLKASFLKGGGMLRAREEALRRLKARGELR